MASLFGSAIGAYPGGVIAYHRTYSNLCYQDSMAALQNFGGIVSQDTIISPFKKPIDASQSFLEELRDEIAGWHGTLGVW
jgi:hypothetical protein